MLQNVHLVTGSWGMLPPSGSWKGGEPEIHMEPPGSCRQLQPVLRVLLTTVMCLSTCAQEASCCLLHCCFSCIISPPCRPSTCHN